MVQWVHSWGPRFFGLSEFFLAYKMTGAELIHVTDEQLQGIGIKERDMRIIIITNVRLAVKLFSRRTR